MRFLIEVGNAKGSSGGLSKMHAKEALIVYRELTGHGLKNDRIIDAKRGELVSETKLIKFAEKDKSPDLPLPCLVKADKRSNTGH